MTEIPPGIPKAVRRQSVHMSRLNDLRAGAALLQNQLGNKGRDLQGILELMCT